MTQRKKDGKRRKRTAGDYIRLAIFVVALGVFIWSAVQLFTIWREYKVGEDEYDNLAQEFVHTLEEVPTAETTTAEESISDAAETSVGQGTEETPPGETQGETTAPPPPPTEPVRFSVDFDALKAVNPDNIGWLIMNGTQVNNPVVRGEDNTHYLRYTYLGTWNIAGCLFMDYRNEDEFQSRNAIIYGHNQKNEKMFGTLQAYRDGQFYKSHPVFQMYTPEGVIQYQIFSAYETGAVSESFQIQFADDEAFQRYLDLIVSRSLYDTGVSVGAGDKILTLSTCTDDTVDRFVVHAKRLN